MSVVGKIKCDDGETKVVDQDGNTLEVQTEQKLDKSDEGPTQNSKLFG